MNRGIYIYLSSEDSKEYFPDNSPENFTIELSRTLSAEKQEVALVDVFFDSYNPQNTGYYFIFCDFVEGSFVGGAEKRVLGSFYRPGALDCLDYHPISEHSLKRLSFQIKTREDNTLHSPVFLKLHVRNQST